MDPRGFVEAKEWKVHVARMGSKETRVLVEVKEWKVRVVHRVNGVNGAIRALKVPRDEWV